MLAGTFYFTDSPREFLSAQQFSGASAARCYDANRCYGCLLLPNCNIKNPACCQAGFML